jgi:hypothetical protein
MRVAGSSRPRSEEGLGKIRLDAWYDGTTYNAAFFVEAMLDVSAGLSCKV